MAIDVQDACNLSGVLRSFVEAAEVLWREAREGTGRGTDWVNMHPVSILFASKVLSLTSGTDSIEKFSKAYAECVALAAEKKAA